MTRGRIYLACLLGCAVLYYGLIELLCAAIDHFAAMTGRDRSVVVLTIFSTFAVMLIAWIAHMVIASRVELLRDRRPE